MSLTKSLTTHFTRIVSETNGISLNDTLTLLLSDEILLQDTLAHQAVKDFYEQLALFSQNKIKIDPLIQHPVGVAIKDFFRNFPVKFKEEHIHLTGALTADFVFPRLQKLLQGPHKAIYEKKIKEVYGEQAWPIEAVEDVDRLIRLKEGEGFMTYLRILYLSKLILVDRQAHREAAYHLATSLYQNYNVGSIRLKFSLSRMSQSSEEQIPGAESVSAEDVLLGLYEGFQNFKQQHPDFRFILSPSFRKEAHFFDSEQFPSRRHHFEHQVNEITHLLDSYPQLVPVLTDVDTVGNENDLYRKEHFNEFAKGFRKLRYRGIAIRSHHGETFHSLRKGIQAVDNAMNIWHIDTLEHGLSLGINPNFYFHRLFQIIMVKNQQGQPIPPKTIEYNELAELEWGEHDAVLAKLIAGKVLNDSEILKFLKAKFHTAREVEHYQHDVLNRMIQKGVSLVSLPSSNNKLTGQFDDYKDHPFSWWEKKGVQLGLGTDNYVTLNTDYLQEMLILLLTDPADLKLTKLLMVTTGETRRPFISHLLWMMRKQGSPT